MINRLNANVPRAITCIGSKTMRPAIWVFLGGLLAAAAVGLGAMGAHVLKEYLTPPATRRHFTRRSSTRCIMRLVSC